MTPAERKEANRYYWIVKGHLIPETWQDKEVRSVLDGYLIRIWGNHENVVLKAIVEVTLEKFPIAFWIVPMDI